MLQELKNQGGTRRYFCCERKKSSDAPTRSRNPAKRKSAGVAPVLAAGFRLAGRVPAQRVSRTASSYANWNADMSEKKLPRESNFFSPPTSRSAAFYQGFLRVTGERCATHAVHPVVHPRVHPSNLDNSRKEKNVDALRREFWARAKHRSGLERPHFFLACAPKKVFRVVPAHTCARKVCTMQMCAIPNP